MKILLLEIVGNWWIGTEDGPGQEPLGWEQRLCGWWQHPNNTYGCLNIEHNIIQYISHAVIKQKGFSLTCMRLLNSILVFNIVSNSPKHFIRYFIYYKVSAIII